MDFGAHSDIAKFYLTNVQDFTEVNTNIFDADAAALPQR